MAIRTELEVDLLECSAPVDGQYPLQFVSIESAGADEKLRFPAGTEGAQREINILLGSNIQAGRLIVGLRGHCLVTGRVGYRMNTPQYSRRFTFTLIAGAGFRPAARVYG